MQEWQNYLTRQHKEPGSVTQNSQSDFTFKENQSLWLIQESENTAVDYYNCAGLHMRN